MKLDESLPNLRTKFALHRGASEGREQGELLFSVIEPCLRQGKEREGFRVVHYSVQGHHLHLIVEAQSAQDLGAGIKGLSVRIARRVNATLGRTGRVFAERYFARVLKTVSAGGGGCGRRGEAPGRRERAPCAPWRGRPGQPSPTCCSMPAVTRRNAGGSWPGAG